MAEAILNQPQFQDADKAREYLEAANRPQNGMQGTTMTDLVMIEWVDSRRPDAAWKHLSDDHDWGAVKCASVGWLVADDKEKKVLAPNMGDIDNSSNMQLAGEIVIPTASVLSISLLVEHPLPSASKQNGVDKPHPFDYTFAS